MSMTSILNNIYDSAINGRAVELANEYIERYGRTELAIDKLVSCQRRKCTTTGFVTGLGGLVSIPVTLPADLYSSLVIQVNMIVAIAVIRGYDVHSEEVKTLVYLCIVGNSIGDVLKQAGIKAVTDYTAKTIIPKLTVIVSQRIAAKVGSKLVVKASAKGLSNAAKMIPVLGGLIGGAYNYAEVSTYANIARERFN